MLLSNAAVLLLGALQPALGAPAPERPALDGTKNEIANHWLTGNETVISYFAPDPKCGGTRPWVGVWPADACNPYSAEFKDWKYAERTEGYGIGVVKFSNAKLGVGEFKAAFVCEDGKRQPWMVSKTFTVDAAPPAENGKCVHRRTYYNPEWTYTQCDKVSWGLCYDCPFGGTCDACNECNEQCGEGNTGGPH